MTELILCLLRRGLRNKARSFVTVRQRGNIKSSGQSWEGCYIRLMGRLNLSRFLIAIGALVLAASSWVFSAGNTVVQLTIDGAISPATTDYLTRALDEAANEQAELVILRMNTPGGLDAATRDINRAILASTVPVATYVSPSGSRAASAGTYILYASHVAAMAPATNLGAATPVQIGAGFSPPSDNSEEPKPDNGESKSDDSEPENEAPAGGAMERKVLNDSIAYIRGLAELRGRNVEWAEEAVREAATLTAAQALEQGVIDYVAADTSDLLQQIDGMEIELGNGAVKTLATEGLEIVNVEPDWRTELLALITDPNIAYLLFLIGVYGLIFEGYNPGAIVPGVVGAICLLLALFAFQVLPINYAGVALIVLGIVLLVAEVFAPSFGVLGIGGLISLMIGSVILIDGDGPDFGVSRSLLGAIGFVSGAIFLAISYMAVRAMRRPPASGVEELVGMEAVALSDFADKRRVHVLGEDWSALGPAEIAQGDSVRITAVEGLKLRVVPSSEPATSTPTRRPL